MKIGIIGSGIVGQVLAKAFTAEGFEVTIGTRDIGKEEMLKFRKDYPNIKVNNFRGTAKYGEIIVLATSGYVASSAIDLAGAVNLKDKIVIDATNPIKAAPPVNGVLQYFTTFDESLMEQLQKKVPEAKFVKAFNSVGNALMYQPDFGGVKPTMFICGNDDAAKKTVTDILTSFGWETEDMGKANAARAIEPLCMLWCIPGFSNNQWRHAFKLLK